MWLIMARRPYLNWLSLHQVITSGNHNRAYIKLACLQLLDVQNGFSWSGHRAVCFRSCLSAAHLREDRAAADKEIILLSDHIIIIIIMKQKASTGQLF